MKFSEEYYTALELHADGHVNGVIRKLDGGAFKVDGSKVFEGSEIRRVLPTIRSLKESLDCRSVLDYGCGKAFAYRLPMVIDGEKCKDFYDYTGFAPAATFLYDPGYQPFKQPPRKDQSFDMTICTDVLEHIPEQDIPAVLDMIFNHTDKVFILTISTHLSRTILDGGVNAHVNTNPRSWWIKQLEDALTRCGKSLVIHLETSNVLGSEEITIDRFKSNTQRT